MIPGSANPLLLASAAGAAGYQIERSLRFNSSDSAYLSRTPSVAGNRKTWTWAGWVKRSSLSTDSSLFTANNDVTNTTLLRFTSADKLRFYTRIGAGDYINDTNAVFRDASAWYHIVCAVDTTAASAANRVKLYVNGIDASLTATPTIPQSSDLYVNATNVHYIGALVAAGAYNSGYLADVHFIDGQALDPTSFGEFDANGVWQPIAYTGTYGTNGFHLDFSDNSTTAALGTDTSGNGNDWTVNNIATFSTTGNYAAYVYASDATYNPSATGTSYYTGAGSQFNGFDGNTNTYVGGENVGASWVYFRPTPSLSNVAQLRVFAQSVEQIYVNGSLASVTPSVPSATSQWYTIISPPSTVTEIALQGQISSSAAARFSAIEVNGVVLIDDKFAASNDSLVDTPTSYGTDTGAGGEVRGNYATVNPLQQTGGTCTFSNGNLQIATPTSNNGIHFANFWITTGKWYWEASITAGSAFSSIGLAKPTHSLVAGGPGILGNSSTTGWGYIETGSKQSGTITSYGASYTTNDVVGVAFDADAGTLTFYKNGSSQGQAFSGLTSGPYLPAASDRNTSTSTTFTWNFGQRPFAYPAPSGFKALCTTNLPAPVVAKPSEVMDVALYTGDGVSGRTISGLSLSPDLVWIKSRSNGTYVHELFDTVRGAGYRLVSNLTNQEAYNANYLQQFNSDGFQLGSGSSENALNETYVAWTWDAGSSTVTSNDGSITSQVRANPSAGFSIVTFTMGSGSNTVGHGLNAVPGLVISKARNTTGNWWVFMDPTLGNDKHLSLNSTNAAATLARGTTTSSLLAVDNNFFANTFDYVAYCFAPVAGYSAFGSYTGNGNADGPFVYTGFRPRFILIKRSDGSGNWLMLDSTRLGYNASNNELQANLVNAEGTYNYCNILSNGFKIQGTDASGNTSGSTYVYYAVAEHPFQTARAR